MNHWTDADQLKAFKAKFQAEIAGLVARRRNAAADPAPKPATPRTFWQRWLDDWAAPTPPTEGDIATRMLYRGEN